jgi:hypothetical protein
VLVEGRLERVSQEATVVTRHKNSR